MKRYLAGLLALLLLLPGCGTERSTATRQDAETIARVVLAFLEENTEADAITWYREPDEVKSYIEECYKLEELELLDGAIARMEGARAFELAVLRVDEGDAEAVTAALREYLLNRQGAFTGYLPDQAELAENGLIFTRGGWAALVVSQDNETARSSFESCFGDGVNAVGTPAILGPSPEDIRPDGRLVYRDPGKEDMTLYDAADILSAWESGDRSALSKKERRVLEAAEAVLDQCITPEMSGYEKELALYGWLTGTVAYDPAHYSVIGVSRDAYEPCGPLLKGRGVCLGFAETFRLLMNMAGVECVTVTGAALRNREHHAWNMVKLNGEWYCADPTWDMNHGVDQDGEPSYRYFNVTSDWMADTDHQWDYDSTPEATAEDGGRPQT